MIFKVIVALLLAGAAGPLDLWASDDLCWTWTGKKLVVCRDGFSAAYDPEKTEWTNLPAPPFKMTSDDMSFRMHGEASQNSALPISEKSVILASLVQSELNIAILSLEDAVWSETCAFRPGAGANSRLGGLAIIRRGLVAVLSPPPPTNLEFDFPPTGKVIIPGKPADPPANGMSYGGKFIRFDVVCKAGPDSVFAFGHYAKSNPCYLWLDDLNRWEVVPKAPSNPETPPFGGTVPRAGYGSCVTDSEVIIYGGHLTWSSAIGMSGAGGSLQGLAWSLEKRTWRLLPEYGWEGLPNPSMCWTGKFVFAAGGRDSAYRTEVYNAVLLDPESDKCTPLKEARFSKVTDSRRIFCFSNGKTVLLFNCNASEGLALDLESLEWRNLPGLKSPELNKNENNGDDKK